MSKENKSERQKLLDARLKSLGVLSQKIEGDKFDTANKKYIPTGISPLDAALGDIPGFAQGTLVELIGESGSGKTHVALSAASECQKAGGRVAFFNIENSFYEPRANQLGVVTRDPNMFTMFPNLGAGEIVCNTIMEIVESELYDLVVVDSISAMIPKDILDKPYEDSPKIGEHARLINRLASKLTLLTQKHNITVILINQFRIGAGTVPNTFVKKGTGGEGLKFFDHYKLIFHRISGTKGEVYDEDKNVIGGRTRVIIEKNRYNRPFVETEFTILFEDSTQSLITDFIMRATDKYNPLIKVTGKKNKKYQYVTEDGEVIEAGDLLSFIHLLQSIAPPSTKIARKDAPTNAFEFICKKIKFDAVMVSNLMKEIQKALAADDNDNENEYEPETADDLE